MKTLSFSPAPGSAIGYSTRPKATRRQTIVHMGEAAPQQLLRLPEAANCGIGGFPPIGLFSFVLLGVAGPTPPYQHDRGLGDAIKVEICSTKKPRSNARRRKCSVASSPARTLPSQTITAISRAGDTFV